MHGWSAAPSSGKHTLSVIHISPVSHLYLPTLSEIYISPIIPPIISPIISPMSPHLKRDPHLELLAPPARRRGIAALGRRHRPAFEG